MQKYCSWATNPAEMQPTKAHSCEDSEHKVEAHHLPRAKNTPKS